MHLEYRNINEAFYALVRGIVTGDVPTYKASSRNGPVLVVDEPVILTYENPLERVLFNRRRDANCLFHLYEALWMLAGRNDVAPLAYYNKRMAEYSDDGKTLNGGYGYRWRHVTTWKWEYSEGPEACTDVVDQLDVIVDHLRANPGSRRAVLSMWNVEDDLLKIDTSRDVACNLSAVFQVREGGPCVECQRRNRDLPFTNRDPCPVCGGPHKQVGKVTSCLDMTVFNRSNDLIWGTLGANAVHFSVLLEYMATRLGLEVGHYHQITANLHAYEWNWKPDEWCPPSRDHRADGDYDASPYRDGPMRLVPLVKDPAAFDAQCAALVEAYSGRERPTPDLLDQWLCSYSEPFLQTVALPLFNAWHFHKQGDLALALRWADLVAADDWRYAAVQWLLRRQQRRRAGVKT